MHPVGFVLTSPLLVMGLGAAAWAYRRWRYAEALEDGVEVPGRVVGFEERELLLGGGTGDAAARPRRVQVAVVEFVDASGRLFRRSGMEGTVGRALHVGSAVRVRHPVGAPEQASVVGENNRLIALAIAAFAVVCLVAWARLTL